MSYRVLREIPLLPRGTLLTCHCKNEWVVPSLWTDDICERCGNLVKNGKDRWRTNSIIKLSLEWAGIAWDRMGLNLGNPHELPKGLIDSLSTSLGHPLTLLDIDDSFQWECQHCGMCCRQNMMLNKYTETLSKEDLVDLGLDIASDLISNPSTGNCGFLNDQNLCAHYCSRPTFCRIMPLAILKFERGGLLTQYVGVSNPACPGFNKGRTQTVREYFKYAGLLHKFFEVGTK